MAMYVDLCSNAAVVGAHRALNVKLMLCAICCCTSGTGSLSDSSDDGARQLSDAVGLNAAVPSSSSISSARQSRADRRSNSSNSNGSSSSSSGVKQEGSPVVAAAHTAAPASATATSTATTATATAAPLCSSPAHTGETLSLSQQQQQQQQHSPPPQLLALQQRLKQMSDSALVARADALLVQCAPQLRAYVQHQAPLKLQLLVQKAPKSAEVQQLSATLLHTLRDGQAALSVLDKYAESKVLPAASVVAALENTLTKVQRSMQASEDIEKKHQQQQQQQQQGSSVSAAAVLATATAGDGCTMNIPV
jgi:hypothetical protein